MSEPQKLLTETLLALGKETFNDVTKHCFMVMLPS